jgi:pyridoxine 5-phosphate synthase
MRKRIRLGFNIDHVATVRNARGDDYPSPLTAAIIAQNNGADSITVHLREDRRHIRDHDLIELKKKIKIPINLEMALTPEMLKIALKLKPKYVCIVPEKRKEVTTEGGLNLNYKKNYLKKVIHLLKIKNIKVSLFIEPDLKTVHLAKKLGSDNIELHTGKYCRFFRERNNLNIKKEFLKIKNSAKLGKKLNLGVHAGHGLNYQTSKKISQIDEITELNIGHFFISESIFFGIANVLKKFNKILKR